MVTSDAWADPNRCPFCGGELASPGSGFVDHIDEHVDCGDEFEAWRGSVAEDVPHGWPG